MRDSPWPGRGGRPPGPPPPCGSVRAYAWHKRHGQRPCPADYEAMAAWVRRWRQSRPAYGDEWLRTEAPGQGGRVKGDPPVDRHNWQRSSACHNESCVEVAWQKSSKSNPSGNSVEVSEGVGNVILIRESDNPARTTETTREKFAAWIAGVKAGEFDHFAS